VDTDRKVSLKGAIAIETTFEHKRKYPRHKAPKGMYVGWKAAGQRLVSRAETVGMGGLFLHTPEPLPAGSLLELLFDLKTGEVRARAIVRNSRPGEGMGVQFVQMQPADRARLNQFLLKYAEAEARAEPDTGTMPSSRTTVSKPARTVTGKTSEKAPETIQFDRDMAERLELARKGTHYQLLEITTESTPKEIKQNFYGLARKFHPDHHMSRAELIAPLKELMAAITNAYKVLTDEQGRASYDAQLAKSGAFHLGRTKTTSRENLEECFVRASENLRANNFVGSIVWLRKCVEMAPTEAKYRALLARSLGTIPQYRSEAIEEFERAIEIDPLNTAVFVQFAELYEEMQLPSRARPLYSKILEINPLHAQARERLAQ
jgi:tetratricopeptide (TPR) repeat protein